MLPDHDEMMRRVAQVCPALAANSPACERARQVVPESMRAMVEAGLFRIPQPARVGGYELSLRSLAGAVTDISQACPSSGWVLMVMGAHHWCMGSFPEAAQEEVFGAGRDGLVAGTLSWQGTAAAADGGWRINGRWQFASGVDRAEWVMVGCANDETGGLGVHVIIPRNEIEVDDTWHVLGLKGTGSKDLVAHDLFVPAHRAIETRALFGGTSPHAHNHRSNLYRVSAEAMLSMSVATAVLGSGKFAVARFMERTRERKAILTGARKAEHAPTQIRLAEAEGEVHCAELLIRDALDEFDGLMAVGEGQSLQSRLRVKWQAAYAAELCRRAAERMFSAAGAHAVYEANTLQTAFRNINVGAQHASIDFDTTAEQYGRMRLTT